MAMRLTQIVLRILRLTFLKPITDKYMNRIIIIVAASIVDLAAFSQQNVVFNYNVGNNYGKEMVLIADPHKSLYFNTMSQYVDSCESTPEGKAKLREIQLKAWRVVQPDGTVTYDGRKLGLAPEKHIFLYVEKNAGNGQLTVYDYKADGLFSYTEPFDEIEWEIVEDSVKTILDHQCIMAVSAYHGRTWKVWFTPDIPLQDGPWKLRGLPGLILQADGGDGFVMEASGLGVTSQPVPYVYSVDTYEKGERKKILADHEYYENNLESILAAQGIKLNADGSPADLPQFDRQKQSLETDY